MSSDPGWTLDPGTAPYQWQYGTPTGSGGDPTSGHTGTKVVGYNLSGQYPNSMSSTQYATTPAFSTVGYTGVSMDFWRWLGVESSSYDHASIQVWDGTTWTTVWNHTSGTVTDTAWTHMGPQESGALKITLPASASNNPTVKIRWGMGTTDSSVTYCGWNIDDVQVTGVPMSPLSVTINQASGQADPTTGTPINFTVVFNEPVTDFATGDVTVSGTAPGTKVGTVTGSGTTYNVAVSGMTGSGTVIATLGGGVAHDSGGNPNNASISTDNTVTYDVTAPTVTINQASGQADPAGSSPINFTVVFSESLTDFATGDVTLGGTAPGTLVGTVTGSGTTYNVAVSGMTDAGTVVATLAAGVAHDAAGNASAASTSTDNTVTYVVSPMVTINQATGQVDPTRVSPINFTVVFNKAVVDFATGDVTLGGTAPGTLVGTVTGSGTTYNVAVSGMTDDGTVVATLAAGVAHDAAGHPNLASTSTDNTVTYDTTPPGVTINQAAAQADPTAASPVNFTVVFTESVADFTSADVTLGGTAPGTLAAAVTGSGTTYNVAASGMTCGGTVVATLAAGVAHDAAGNASTASTSTDNAVTYVFVPPVYTASMDADPGWTFDAGSAPYQWQYGTPSGGGSYNHDPVSGHTGSKVVGYNLSGDYPNSMTSTQYATTPAFTTVGYTSLKLGFWRWLGVESSSYDHASIQVWDGTTWTTVWQNTTSTTADSAWTYCEYALPASVSDKPAVQIRWGMGTTNTSVTYPGWNIDDVQVTGTPLGILQPGSIEGDKWSDLNNDGVRDAGEPTVPGWTIYLDLDNDGQRQTGEPSTVTDASGHYAFADLAGGTYTYTVREVPKTGWTQTYPGQWRRHGGPRRRAGGHGQRLRQLLDFRPNRGRQVERPERRRHSRRRRADPAGLDDLPGPQQQRPARPRHHHGRAGQLRPRHRPEHRRSGPDPHRPRHRRVQQSGPGLDGKFPFDRDDGLWPHRQHDLVQRVERVVGRLRRCGFDGQPRRHLRRLQRRGPTAGLQFGGASWRLTSRPCSRPGRWGR